MSIWLQLDTVLPVVAVVATLLALAVRRLRPFAVAMIVLLAMLVRPGYLPVPFVVALSRVIYGVHYPTDVCTSLVLTPVLVWCVYRLCDPAR